MPALIQLFTAHALRPWDTVLDQIAAAGFDGVEGYFGCFDDPAGFRALLDARGLIMPQAHVPLTMLEGDLPGAVALLHTLGANRAIMPWLAPEERPATAAGWRALGLRLHAIDLALRDRGVSFAYHNHDFELVPVEGRTPISILLQAAPGMGWEPDLGWALAAGLDPLAVIAPHRDRIVTVHLKDRRAPGDATEQGWADLGHGTGDWPAIARALRSLPGLDSHVVEHDAPTALGAFLTRSRATYDAVFGGLGPQRWTSLLHVTLMARDLEQSVAFYRDTLDLPEMMRITIPDTGMVIVYLRITATNYLELFSGGQTAGAAPFQHTGLNHLCLGVARMEPALARLRDRGVPVLSWQDGVLAPKTDPGIVTGLDGNRQAWITDPDGNRVELMEMAPDCLQYQALARLG